MSAILKLLNYFQCSLNYLLFESERPQQQIVGTHSGLNVVIFAKIPFLIYLCMEPPPGTVLTYWFYGLMVYNDTLLMFI